MPTSVGRTSGVPTACSRARSSGTRNASTRNVPAGRSCASFACGASVSFTRIWYVPRYASFGTANVASPDGGADVPFHFTGTSYSFSEPRCRIVSVSSSALRGGSAKPPPVCCRTKSFIDTVSPARTSERSSTACATYGPFQLPVGTLKRHGAMPSPQLDSANATSSSVRAVTKNSRAPSSMPQDGSPSRSGSAGSRARCPTRRCGPPSTRCRRSRGRPPPRSATGVASFNCVTQTSEDSRPSLKCTDRFVTITAARTWNGFGSPSSAAPSFGLASSTT